MQKRSLFLVLALIFTTSISGAACFLRRLVHIVRPALSVRTYASNDDIMKRLEELHQKVDTLEARMNDSKVEPARKTLESSLVEMAAHIQVLQIYASLPATIKKNSHYVGSKKYVKVSMTSYEAIKKLLH